MDFDGLARAIKGFAEEGYDAVRIRLDRRFVDVPLGEDNKALSYRDNDGFVVFMIGDVPRTEPVRLVDVTAVEALGAPRDLLAEMQP